MIHGFHAPPREVVARFEPKVDRSGGPTACWPWRAGRTPKGYGRLKVDGRQVAAHRLAFIIANGPIPSGKFVCHACDNPPCCNPAHLWLGSPRDNVRDCMAKGRLNPKGNPFCRGELHHRATLDAKAVRAIRESYAAGGVSMRRLAALHGVSYFCVHSVVTGRTWAHVEPAVAL